MRRRFSLVQMPSLANDICGNSTEATAPAAPFGSTLTANKAALNSRWIFGLSSPITSNWVGASRSARTRCHEEEAEEEETNIACEDDANLLHLAKLTAKVRVRFGVTRSCGIGTCVGALPSHLKWTVLVSVHVEWNTIDPDPAKLSYTDLFTNLPSTNGTPMPAYRHLLQYVCCVLST